MQKYNFKTKEEFLYSYIDLYSALFIDRENWLTKREMDYFIAHIELFHNNIDFLSEHATNYLKVSKEFKNRAISIYRKKLKDKGWIIQTPSAIDIPKTFKFNSNKPFPTKVNFDFSVNWTKE